MMGCKAGMIVKETFSPVCERRGNVDFMMLFAICSFYKYSHERNERRQFLQVLPSHRCPFAESPSAPQGNPGQSGADFWSSS